MKKNYLAALAKAAAVRAIKTVAQTAIATIGRQKKTHKRTRQTTHTIGRNSALATESRTKRTTKEHGRPPAMGCLPCSFMRFLLRCHLAQNREHIP